MTEETTLSLRLDSQMLLDIAIVGIDWSCRAFWAEIDRFPSARLFDGYEERLKDGTLPEDEVLFRLRDDEDGKAEAKERPWLDVTLGGLRAATVRAINEYSHLYSLDIGKAKDGGYVITEINTDGPNCDIILQFATLDEVVYA